MEYFKKFTMYDENIKTTTSNNTTEGITPESILKIIETLNSSKVERKGYIMMPSLKGFDLYEIDEERLRSYLAIESMNNKLKTPKRN